MVEQLQAREFIAMVIAGIEFEYVIYDGMQFNKKKLFGCDNIFDYESCSKDGLSTSLLSVIVRQHPTIWGFLDAFVKVPVKMLSENDRFLLRSYLRFYTYDEINSISKIKSSLVKGKVDLMISLTFLTDDESEMVRNITIYNLDETMFKYLEFGKWYRLEDLGIEEGDLNGI